MHLPRRITTPVEDPVDSAHPRTITAALAALPAPADRAAVGSLTAAEADPPEVAPLAVAMASPVAEALAAAEQAESNA